MKHFIVALMAIMATSLIARSDNRTWNAGKLQWHEFSNIPGAYSSTSAFRAHLEIVPADTVINGTKKVKLEAVAVMDKNSSYAANEVRTTELLNLYQTQFDLLESYRRDLQHELNNGISMQDAEKSLKFYNNLYKEKVENMTEATNNGANSDEMAKWESQVSNRLGEQENPSLKIMEMPKFSYGAYVGMGLNGTTSTVHSAFSNSWAFSAGILLGYKRIKFKADITYTQPKINNLNIMGVPEQETSDVNASYLAITPAIGFTVFETESFSITPFVGGSWTRYEWNVANYKYEENKETGEIERKIDNYESPSLSNFNWYVSVDLEYRFKKHYATAEAGNRERISYAVRLSPYLIRSLYSKANPELKGFQLGFTIAFAFNANYLSF